MDAIVAQVCSLVHKSLFAFAPACLDKLGWGDENDIQFSAFGADQLGSFRTESMRFEIADWRNH